MQKKRMIGLVSIFSIFLIIVIALFSKGEIKNAEEASAETLGIPVEVVLAKTENIQEAFNYIGTVKSKSQASLSFKLSGIIQEIFVDEGDSFEEGQVLAELNMEDLRARYETIRQKIGGAQINIDYLKDQADKNKLLYDEGAVSYQQYLDISYKYQMAGAAYREALATAKEMEVSIKSGQVYAPYSGSVRELLNQKGEMVQPGQAVFSVSEQNDLIVEIAVIEKDLPAVAVGAKAILHIAKGDITEMVEGTVSSISSVLNPQTRTANVEIPIPPGFEYLLPNMSVSISLVKGEKADAVVVPATALLKNADGNILYVYHEGKALAREVKVGLNNGIMVEIIEGAVVGDQVIISTLTKIKDGDTVFVYKGVESY